MENLLSALSRSGKIIYCLGIISTLLLTNCHRTGGTTKINASLNNSEIEESELQRLYMDIIHAQKIEAHEPNFEKPDEPIHYEYGTDAQHKKYYFANLSEFRKNIKHRLDSLRNTGLAYSYDTLLEGSTVHGKLRIEK